MLMLVISAGTVLAGNTKNTKLDNPAPGKISLDPRVWQKLQAAVDNYCTDPLSRYIFMVKAGKAELGPNLARNSGFEQVWCDVKKVSEGEEWRKSIAYGWGVTPRFWLTGGLIDTIKYEKNDEKFGWRSGRISHVNGYYMRSGIGRIYPGKAYLVRAFVKLHQQTEINLEKSPEIALCIKWWGKGWLYTNIYRKSYLLNQVGKWCILEMVVIPKRKAEYAVAVLSVANMQRGTKVLFDNLSFQEIKIKNNQFSKGKKMNGKILGIGMLTLTLGFTGNNLSADENVSTIDIKKMKLGSNMVRNSGFEKVWGTDKKIPKGQEWRKDIADGWSVTPNFWKTGGKIDTVKYDKKDKEFGWRSGRISHLNGYYARSDIGRVYPGKKYLVKAYVKLNVQPEGKQKPPEVTLRVQWLGKGWLYKNIYKKSLPLTEVGKWIPVEMVVSPTEKANYASAFIVTSNMRNGTDILVDNFSFREIKAENKTETSKGK